MHVYVPLAFHSNYGAILYRLRDRASYCRKSRNLYTPPVFSAAAGGGTPPSELANTFDTHKTMIGLPCGEEIDNMLSFLIQYRNVTDRRTDRHNSYISISIAVLTHDKNGKTHICRHETVLVEGQ